MEICNAISDDKQINTKLVSYEPLCGITSIISITLLLLTKVEWTSMFGSIWLTNVTFTDDLIV